MSPDAGSQKGRKTPRGKAPKSQSPKRHKCSLLLTPENDLRLTVLANIKGLDRSELINVILDDALRGVVVSLRGPLAEAGVGEGASDSEPESEAA
jgi:hypothetical protein